MALRLHVIFSFTMIILSEAFVLPRTSNVIHGKKSLAKTIIHGSAFESLAESQSKTIAKIRTSIPETTEKPDASWSVEAGRKAGGAVAVLQAFDAPGPSNIAWLSALGVEDKLSSLTIINGPLTDVPHLCSRCIVDANAGTLSMFIDWRPRDYGAYETRKDDGSYPGPDVLGRDAFKFSGARLTMEKAYYTTDLEAFVADTVAGFDGATQPQDASELDVLVRGPLFMDVTMALTDSNVAKVVAAREKAADIWLEWQLDDSHRLTPGAPVNSQYVFDTPAKQSMYCALLETYTKLFGSDDGPIIAAADSGPLDEGYVGGGS